MKRWDIINALIKKYGLKSYLEIGVFQGECFDKIECDVKHSVDPEFEATFRMASDEFFEHPMRFYDLIFIDGLHTREQASRDIWNAWNVNARFIVVHDTNPKTEWHTRPVEQYKRGEEWNGTTYLGALDFLCLMQEDVGFFTIDTDHGVTVISDEIDPIHHKIRMPETWEYFDKNRKELLNLQSEEYFTAFVS
jgi:hypothetical protein